jgi:hypothetical protein
MALPCCPYCGEPFTPSRYHPRQAVCSTSACQRQRRNDDHRHRINEDASYRAQCLDSQQKWREEHPEYMRNYRRTHLRKPARSLSELLKSVKNSTAVNLSSYSATVWLISSDKNVKNILANTELILVEAASRR